MKNIGFILVVLGVLALVYGGISYSQQRTIVDFGSFKATATEQKSLPLPPIFGGIAVIGGLVLLMVPRRRLA